jgi:hypothetical protein
MSVCLALHGLVLFPNPTNPSSRHVEPPGTDDSKALFVFASIVSLTDQISAGSIAPTDLHDVKLTDGEASEKPWRSTNGTSIQQHVSVSGERSHRENNRSDHSPSCLIVALKLFRYPGATIPHRRIELTVISGGGFCQELS